MSSNELIIGEIRAGLTGVRDLVEMHTRGTERVIEAQGKTLDLLAKTTSDNSGQIRVMFQRLEAHETRDANITAEIKSLKRIVIGAVAIGVLVMAVFAPDQLPRVIRFVASLA